MNDRILFGRTARKGLSECPRKRHTVDQNVAILRQADVELGKRKKVSEICKFLEVTEQTALIGLVS